MKKTPLRMESTHIRPDQNLTLLLRRQARENLLNRRRLRGHKRVVLRRPSRNVRE